MDEQNENIEEVSEEIEQADVPEPQMTEQVESSSEPQPEERAPELPAWWRFDDKIPSDRQPTDKEKSQAGRVWGMTKGVFGKNAKLYNILTLVFLSVVLITMIVGLFSPVFILYDKYDRDAFIVDEIDVESISGHYIKVNQSGWQMISAAVKAFDRNDDKARKLKSEHERALASIQAEHALWVLDNPSANMKEIQKKYEEIFKSQMSQTDFVGFLSASAFSSIADESSRKAASEVMSFIIPSVMLVAISFIVCLIFGIVFATKTVTELTNKSDRIMYWHSIALLLALSLSVYMAGMFFGGVSFAYLFCPVILHMALSIFIGVMYTKKRGLLNAKLIGKSVVAPVLVMIGLGMMFGTEYATITVGNVTYASPVFPVCSILLGEKLGSTFNSNTIIIGYIVFMVLLFAILFIYGRILKKRAKLGVETPMSTLSGIYAQVVTVVFIAVIILTIVCLCAKVCTIHINVLQYIAAVLCAAPLLYERIVKMRDYKKRLKAAKTAQAQTASDK